MKINYLAANGRTTEFDVQHGWKERFAQQKFWGANTKVHVSSSPKFSNYDLFLDWLSNKHKGSAVHCEKIVLEIQKLIVICQHFLGGLRPPKPRYLVGVFDLPT